MADYINIKKVETTELAADWIRLNFTNLKKLNNIGNLNLNDPEEGFTCVGANAYWGSFMIINVAGGIQTIINNILGDLRTADEITETSTRIFSTPEEKAKLEDIEEFANNYNHPDTHSANMITESSPNRIWFNEYEEHKLNTIQSGANNYNHPPTHPIAMITGLLDSGGKLITPPKPVFHSNIRHGNLTDIDIAYSNAGFQLVSAEGMDTSDYIGTGLTTPITVPFRAGFSTGANSGIILFSRLAFGFGILNGLDKNTLSGGFVAEMDITNIVTPSAQGNIFQDNCFVLSNTDPYANNLINVTDRAVKVLGITTDSRYVIPVKDVLGSPGTPDWHQPPAMLNNRRTLAHPSSLYQSNVVYYYSHYADELPNINVKQCKAIINGNTWEFIDNVETQYRRQMITAKTGCNKAKIYYQDMEGVVSDDTIFVEYNGNTWNGLHARIYVKQRGIPDFAWSVGLDVDIDYSPQLTLKDIGISKDIWQPDIQYTRYIISFLIGNAVESYIRIYTLNVRKSNLPLYATLTFRHEIHSTTVYQKILNIAVKDHVSGAPGDKYSIMVLFGPNDQDLYRNDEIATNFYSWESGVIGKFSVNYTITAVDYLDSSYGTTFNNMVSIMTIVTTAEGYVFFSVWNLSAPTDDNAYIVLEGMDWGAEFDVVDGVGNQLSGYFSNIDVRRGSKNKIALSGSTGVYVIYVYLRSIVESGGRIELYYRSDYSARNMIGACLVTDSYNPNVSLMIDFTDSVTLLDLGTMTWNVDMDKGFGVWGYMCVHPWLTAKTSTFTVAHPMNNLPCFIFTYSAINKSNNTNLIGIYDGNQFRIHDSTETNFIASQTGDFGYIPGFSVTSTSHSNTELVYESGFSYETEPQTVSKIGETYYHFGWFGGDYTRPTSLNPSKACKGILGKTLFIYVAPTEVVNVGFIPNTIMFRYRNSPDCLYVTSSLYSYTQCYRLGSTTVYTDRPITVLPDGSTSHFSSSEIMFMAFFSADISNELGSIVATATPSRPLIGVVSKGFDTKGEKDDFLIRTTNLDIPTPDAATIGTNEYLFVLSDELGNISYTTDIDTTGLGYLMTYNSTNIPIARLDIYEGNIIGIIPHAQGDFYTETVFVPGPTNGVRVEVNNKFFSNNILVFVSFSNNGVTWYETTTPESWDNTTNIHFNNKIISISNIHSSFLSQVGDTAGTLIEIQYVKITVFKIF